MQLPKKFEVSSLSVYLPSFLALFSIAHVGEQGEPFGFALLFALCAAGIPPSLPCIFYVFSSLFPFDPLKSILYGGQALLLALAFLIKNRFFKRDKGSGNFFTFSAYLIGLVLFVLLSPFNAYPLPFNLDFLNNPLVQKAFLALFLTVLASAMTVGIRALTDKFLKCRFKSDETIFLAAAFLCVGVGFCRFFGIDAYMGVCFFLLLIVSHLTKDATAVLIAFLLALPSYLVAGVGMERFFMYGVVLSLFSRISRLSGTCALLVTFILFGYLDGVYAYPTPALVGAILSALLPALIFILFPQKWITKMESALVFYKEKHLSRIAINRNRAAIGEQLFEISSLFREIQTTFSALGNGEAENGAKNYIVSHVESEICKKCSGYGTCKALGLKESLIKIVEIGSIKGKVSMIDVPSSMARTCGRQSDLLFALNRKFAEYRKYMTEAENAACGRQLLADQAQGVSEIIKNIALEQSEPLGISTSKEKSLIVALSKIGILASEVLIYGGEDNPTVSLVTFGNANAGKIAKVASSLFQSEMCISEKLALGKEKYCCILRKKPKYDAAFGVATCVKGGEGQSGDTHSTLKIDEKKFLVALSDGMGSGEYAKKISECTISLLESFYRSKMPPPLILSTVNKLLTFSKEESFACVDIAVVDLENGCADVVKIGSPMGFILSDTSLKILESESLPLGILESIRPSVASYPLKENDTLLFLSDGITDAFSSSSELYDFLKTVPASNPQRLADELLAAADARYGGVAKDDMTAIAVRIFKSVA